MDRGMKKAHILRVLIVMWGGVVLFFTGIGMSGCALMQSEVSSGARLEEGIGRSQEKLQGEEKDLALWEDGMRAYDRRDYTMARRAFEALSKSAATEDMRLTALYALAATRLTMAQDPADYKAGMDILELWSQVSPKGMYDEDPRMLLPLLQRTVPPASSPQPTQTGQSANGTTKGPKGGEFRKNPSKDVVKTVKAKDKEYESILRDREKEIKGLKHQVWMLRQQMEALETIHREIQEKKEQVSHP
jgi:hypothetical protein